MGVVAIAPFTHNSSAVGFQNGVTCKAGAYNMQVATFDNIAGTTKLGDFKAVKAGEKKITQNNFNVQFYNKTGVTATVADDPEILKLIPEESMDDFLEWYGEEGVSFSYIDGTWYLTCDEDNDFPMDDYPVPYGIGFLLNTTTGFTEGAYIVYAGQVAAGSMQSVTCKAGAYDMTGNVAPTAFVLKDFIAQKAGEKKITQNNFNVQFYNLKGVTATVQDDAEILKLVPEESMDDFLEWYGEEGVSFSYIDGTWYLTCDEDNDFPMDDYPVPAGQGFLMNTTTGYTEGAYLILPTAL